MKRTLRILICLALVAILFASCENNAGVPEVKTAADYLFGNSIFSTVYSTVEITDAEGNVPEGEGAIMPEGLDYCFLNYSFDENGEMSINDDGVYIEDFESTIDGMNYKVSLTALIDTSVSLGIPGDLCMSKRSS